MFIVGGNNFFYNGKSQAGTFFVLAAGLVSLVETIPNLFLTFLGDANAGITDRDKDFVIAFIGLQPDHGVVVGKFDGVVDQVVENLLDLAHVGPHHHAAGGKGQIKGDGLGTAGGLKGGSRVFDHLIDIKVGLFQIGAVYISGSIRAVNAANGNTVPLISLASVLIRTIPSSS